MRIRYGVSPWIDQFPKSRRPDSPRFKGEADVPVLIVGGGLTGIMTAYALAAAGIEAVLLEADRLGASGAGRAPGLAIGEAAPSFKDIDARFGRRRARAVFDASRRAVLDLATTARRLQIKARQESADAIRLAAAGAAEKALRKDVDARRDAGLDARWIKGAALDRDLGLDAAGAARLRDWLTLDPYRLLEGFARAATKRGARLHERSRVRRLKVQRRHVEAHVEGGGIVRAGHVIVCTGEPTALFRPLIRHFRLQERYVVLTEPVPAAVRKQLGAYRLAVADTEMPPHAVRWTEDERLLVAGADQARTPARGRDKVLVQRTGQLMYELSRIFPAISGLPPAYGWDVPVASANDGLLVAGPHRNYPRHLFAWGTGHDPAQAFLASRILLRALQEQPDKTDAYFAFTRK